MALKLIVDGRSYDVPETYTFRELSLIKKVAGVRAGQIEQALQEGDTDVIVAMACIAMRRAGQTVDIDTLLDREMTAIEAELEEPEPDPQKAASDESASADAQAADAA